MRGRLAGLSFLLSVQRSNFLYFLMNRSIVVSLFIGFLTKNGGRNKAELIFSDLLFSIKRKFKLDPLDVLVGAVERAKPRLELRPRVIAGTVYKIPSVMKEGLDSRLAVKWIIESSINRSGKSVSSKLLDEIWDTYSGSSSSVKRRDELHKLVLANRPLLKYFK